MDNSKVGTPITLLVLSPSEALAAFFAGKTLVDYEGDEAKIVKVGNEFYLVWEWSFGLPDVNIAKSCLPATVYDLNRGWR